MEVVRELLKHGPSIESTNNNGWTTFNSAADKCNVDVVRELLKNGVSVESANNDGWKSLNSAAKEGHVEVVRELLKHGANMESALKTVGHLSSQKLKKATWMLSKSC